VRVAVMQPYFMPYAGYFRLLAIADLFVAYDCVQFPRRGWVHRNRFTDANGNPAWLTLPLRKGDRDTTRICDLQFASDAEQRWQDECRRLPALERLRRWNETFAASFFTFSSEVTQYIIQGLEQVASMLGLRTPIVRSSSIHVDPLLKGQDRILEICKHVGAKEYFNASGGRALYDPKAFERRGLTLKFFSDYRGHFGSILERLILEPAHQIRTEIDCNLETSN
jgi:hypothetical protein